MRALVGVHGNWPVMAGNGIERLYSRSLGSLRFNQVPVEEK